MYLPESVVFQKARAPGRSHRIQAQAPGEQVYVWQGPRPQQAELTVPLSSRSVVPPGSCEVSRICPRRLTAPQALPLKNSLKTLLSF